MSRIQQIKTLFLIFLKISAVTVGGGLTMLPLITDEFVEKRKWISQDEMIDAVAVVQSMPGILAANLSVLLGYRIAGIPGALSATLGVSLPPFITIMLIVTCLNQIGNSPELSHAFLGVRAAVCALILVSVIKLGRKALCSPFAITLAVAGFLGLILFNFNIILLIFVAGCIGLLHEWILPLRKHSNDSSKKEKETPQ